MTDVEKLAWRYVTRIKCLKGIEALKKALKISKGFYKKPLEMDKEELRFAAWLFGKDAVDFSKEWHYYHANSDLLDTVLNPYKVYPPI